MAYSPGHPDAPESLEEAESRAQELLAGESGRLLQTLSAAILDTSTNTLVGAVVVTWEDPAQWGWDGGPWVADIFIVPMHQGRGLGRALL
jgi:GNAT superfamily N-acetyltransferase